MPAPLYRSRSTQIAAHLRERLAQWPERLPGERLLAAQLGVGRRTIRAALNQLEAEGLLHKHGPRRGSRLAPAAPGMSPTRRKVGLLLTAPFSSLHRSGVVLVDALRAFFFRHEVDLHLHDLSASPKQGAFPYFRRLYETLHYDAWLLSGSTQPMQTWCERERLPVILASAPFPGVALPAVELGFHATCRHAVGQMIRAGHRHLALLVPKLPPHIAPGDQASVAGFLEGVEAFAIPGLKATVEKHPQEQAAFCAMLDELLQRSPRPSAWLVRTPYFLTTLVYLLQRGVRIPQEVALVCRDREDYFQHLPLAPSCYATPPGAKAQQLGQLTMRLLNGETLAPHCHWVLPEWVDGETL